MTAVIGLFHCSCRRIRTRAIHTGRIWFKENEKKTSKSKSVYSSTVLLPKTSFPTRLEGEKRIDCDRRVIGSDSFQSVYSIQKEQNRDRSFALHDGPPYANGEPHLGHAINKILKDIINRWKMVNGFKVDYRPGWDCHGLPIELKARTAKDEADDNSSPNAIREVARKFATKTIEVQKTAFKSWGVIGDWKRPYLTMTPDYVKNQFRCFYEMYEKGYIFQRFMPVYWSPVSRTALAESELEYNKNHESTSVYAKCEMDSVSCERITGDSKTKCYLVIWTTTPWSLVGNKAICFNSHATYLVLRKNESHYILAKDLFESNKDLKRIFCDFAIIKEIPGAILTGCHYFSPLTQDLCPVLPGSHVTMEMGSGLVHTAPSHGQEDYLVGVDHDLDLTCPVDGLGRFDDHKLPSLRGLPVLGEGSDKVIELLKANDLLLESHPFIHSYPYDWRSKTPVILRASKQWFINVDKLKDAALEVLDQISISPNTAGFGFRDVIVKRPYWCVSRQRVWGAPIPVLYNERDEPILTRELIEKFCGLIDTHGPDFWWTLSDHDILKNTELQGKGGITKGLDIMDVWFDSGISWTTLNTESQVADLYLEGLDQFSGWFYTSLMTSLALRSKSSYNALYVHGFAVDETGKKMSKSIGNVISPNSVTEGSKDLKVVFGVDTLRYWVAAHGSQGASVPAGHSIFMQTKEELNRARLIFRFLLGNLKDFSPSESLVSYENLSPLDQYCLHRLSELWTRISEHYESFQFNKVVLDLCAFFAKDLSAFYFHRVKDTLYCDSVSSPRRQSCLTTLWYILNSLHSIMAPLTPVLIYEIQEANHLLKDPFINPYQMNFQDWRNETISTVFDNGLQPIFEAIMAKVGEVNLKNTAVEIQSGSEEIRQALAYLDNQDLREFFQVASVSASFVINSSEDFIIETYSSDLHVCPRCRLRKSSSPEGLCDRCKPLVVSV